MGQSPLAFFSPAIQEKIKNTGKKSTSSGGALVGRRSAHVPLSPLFFSFDAYANKKFAAYTAADLSASGSGIRRTALHFCFHAALFGLEVRQGRRKNPHSNQCDPAGSRPARQLGRTNSDRNRETTHNNNAHRFKKK